MRERVAERLCRIGRNETKAFTSSALAKARLPGASCVGVQFVAADTDFGFDPKVHDVLKKGDG